MNSDYFLMRSLSSCGLSPSLPLITFYAHKHKLVCFWSRPWRTEWHQIHCCTQNIILSCAIFLSKPQVSFQMKECKYLSHNQLDTTNVLIFCLVHQLLFQNKKVRYIRHCLVPCSPSYILTSIPLITFNVCLQIIQLANVTRTLRNCPLQITKSRASLG